MLWNLPQCQKVCLSGSKFPSPREVEPQSHQRWGWRKAQGGFKGGKTQVKFYLRQDQRYGAGYPGVITLERHYSPKTSRSATMRASSASPLNSEVSRARDARRPVLGVTWRQRFSGSRWLGPGRCRRRCGFWHATGKASTREESTRDRPPRIPRSCAVKAKLLTSRCSEGKYSFMQGGQVARAKPAPTPPPPPSSSSSLSSRLPANHLKKTRWGGGVPGYLISSRQFSDWLMVTNPEGPEGLGLRARDLQVLNFFHLVAGFRWKTTQEICIRYCYVGT